VLLSIEIVMLAVFSVVALIRVYAGTRGVGVDPPAASWFNPFHIHSFSTSPRASC